jgi:hypothetical protein
MNSDNLFLLIVSVISWIVLPALYRIFKKPGDVLSGERSRAAVRLIIFTYLGLTIFSLLVGGRFFSALFITYPMFYAVIYRQQIRSTKLMSSKFALFTIPFLLLWFEEIFAVLDYQGQILPHFIHYIGYYLGYALVIYIFFRRRSYSFAQVLTIGGILGVLIEGEFMLPQFLLQGLSGNPDALLFMILSAPFIFLTHGFYLAGPYLLFYEEVSSLPKANKQQVIFLAIALLIIPLLAWGIWSMILGAGGFNPAGVI